MKSDIKDMWSSALGKTITIMLTVLIAISGFVAKTTLGNSVILSEQKGWMNAQGEKVSALQAVVLNQQVQIGDLNTKVAVLRVQVEDARAHADTHR